MKKEEDFHFIFDRWIFAVEEKIFFFFILFTKTQIDFDCVFLSLLNNVKTGFYTESQRGDLKFLRGVPR